MKTFISIALIAFFVSFAACHSSGSGITGKSDTAKTCVLIVVDSTTGQTVARSAYRISTVKKTIDAPDKVKSVTDTLFYVQWPIAVKDSAGNVVKDAAGNAKNVFMFTPIDKKFILIDLNKSFF